MSSFILLFSCSKAEDDELPKKDGLISFYNFQGNADDVYGDNDGRETNAIYVTDDFLYNNKVLLLDGSNSYISIPEIVRLRNQDHQFMVQCIRINTRNGSNIFIR